MSPSSIRAWSAPSSRACTSGPSASAPSSRSTAWRQSMRPSSGPAEPRPVRFYPSRGVTYESHLAPPPHLVGLRVAALDALIGAGDSAEEPPVVVVSAVALSEKVPDPGLRPQGLRLARGDVVDLDEFA